MSSILQVRNIEKYFGNKGNVTKAIDDLSFEVEPGEFIGIMGPSGSGKTTLLNCLSTIDRVTTGDVIINGKKITSLNRRGMEKFRRQELGFIFQDFYLLDTLTVYENIALALTIQGVNTSEIQLIVNDITEKLEIKSVLSKFPYEISGGQKQRVACARAMVTQPTLVFADEPTGALDSKSSRILLESLEKLNQDLNTTILMVTHDAYTASYTNRILFIKDGKIFNEIVKGTDTQYEFFKCIMEVNTLLGGDINHVF
ncbi:ABC transporter ATP-binding protein [Hazenella sp. IB182357]|uniref:ABC transporter ATP-binding protein n=1 Tax=Polycladospora coralii TaxID=2771432 RepID=A0A926N5E0_9BACL|nr:ABC transporter ATP-binding protein [Polycladospora coralii]MBD1371689.1 ABC transporter ATP-binding protein [Polycladospora coralii]MBS7529156.1 ABC transporter ATP-binding protein [Polycladospora coralii]